MADLMQRAHARGIGAGRMFGCLRCAALWQSYSGGGVRCPNCGTWLVRALTGPEVQTLLDTVLPMVADAVGGGGRGA